MRRASSLELDRQQIHAAVITTVQLSPKIYGLNQLRYDLRKLKGHGLLDGNGRRYAYRLTTKGVDIALLFLFFHKRLCGPLANSASTTSVILNIGPTVKLKLRIIKLIWSLRTSLTSYGQLDVPLRLMK